MNCNIFINNENINKFEPTRLSFVPYIPTYMSWSSFLNKLCQRFIVITPRLLPNTWSDGVNLLWFNCGWVEFFVHSSSAHASPFKRNYTTNLIQCFGSHSLSHVPMIVESHPHASKESWVYVVTDHLATDLKKKHDSSSSKIRLAREDQ